MLIKRSFAVILISALAADGSHSFAYGKVASPSHFYLKAQTSFQSQTLAEPIMLAARALLTENHSKVRSNLIRLTVPPTEHSVKAADKPRTAWRLPKLEWTTGWKLAGQGPALGLAVSGPRIILSASEEESSSDRTPSQLGSHDPIDYRNLLDLFPHHDSLVYLFADLAGHTILSFQRTPPDAAVADAVQQTLIRYQELEREFQAANNFRTAPPEAVADHYRRIVQLARERIVPARELVLPTLSDPEDRELMLNYIAEAEEFVQTMELLLDDRARLVEVTRLSAVVNFAFAHFHGLSSCVASFNAVDAIPAFSGSASRWAYLLLSLAMTFRAEARRRKLVTRSMTEDELLPVVISASQINSATVQLRLYSDSADLSLDTPLSVKGIGVAPEPRVPLDASIGFPLAQKLARELGCDLRVIIESGRARGFVINVPVEFGVSPRIPRYNPAIGSAT